VADAAPAKIKMRAPTGVTSYSHQGIEHQIEDGMIEIDERSADVFRAFGFTLA